MSFEEPAPNACRPVDGEDDAIEYVWTVPDGRGIVHPHGEDGCPFEPGGVYFGKGEELLAGMGPCGCADCGGPL